MREKYPGLAEGYNVDDIVFDPEDPFMTVVDSEEE